MVASGEDQIRPLRLIACMRLFGICLECEENKRLDTRSVHKEIDQFFLHTLVGPSRPDKD